jgi:hypothetical protein
MLSDTDHGAQLCDVRAADDRLSFAFVSADPQTECVREIAAFVCGGMVGLIRLKKVLPNIFKNFEGCDPRAALEQCGLFPQPGYNGDLSFYLDINTEGRAMLDPNPTSRKRARCPTADQLQDVYEAVSSSWSSHPTLRSSSNS